ncbi:MAG: hypothetical protein K8F36_08855 [Melioribacteraceae bacterium]|nr:hypothetical protein [Melioribacteraceae bacterium]MCO6474638.1 hypothetical protein [Melioribacteraceae bacterium]
MKVSILIILLSIPSIIFGQNKSDELLDQAILKAKKGIYWAYENIPLKKSSLKESLISEDELVAEVKIDKTIEGVIIESKGYSGTYTAQLTIYKSYDSLVKEGYLKTLDASR